VHYKNKKCNDDFFLIELLYIMYKLMKIQEELHI